MKLICIVCPNGCELTAEKPDGAINVSGNKCPRGIEFAKAELTHPMRTVCSTVRTAFPLHPVLPVRTGGEIPKERVRDLMKELQSVTVTKPLGVGDTVIENVLGLGVNIIATSDLLKRRTEDII